MLTSPVNAEITLPWGNLNNASAVLERNIQKRPNEIVAAAWRMSALSAKLLFVITQRAVEQNQRGDNSGVVHLDNAAIEQLAKMLNFKVSVFADKLKGWIKEIQESPVEIQKKTHVNVQDDGSAEPVELVFPAGWVQYWWLTSVEFDNKGKGKMSATFCFNPQLYPYLINIDRYTKINMETVLSFKSFYTIRLYEHFSQLLFKANPVWIQTMSVETVRHVFKLEGSYKNSSNMRTKVFDVAIE
jgi:hypothetical protein